MHRRAIATEAGTLVLLVLLLVGGTASGQATLTVPDDYPTIRAADPEMSVVDVLLRAGEVEVTGLGVSHGMAGLAIVVEPGALVKVLDILVVENAFRVFGRGAEVLWVGYSLHMDSECGACTPPEDELLGYEVARRVVERLMRRIGVGGRCSGEEASAILPEEAVACRADLVRGFPAGRFRPAVRDGYQLRICLVGVRVRDVRDPGVPAPYCRTAASRALRSDLPLDALEQALYAQPDTRELVHHRDRGVRSLAIPHTERKRDGDRALSRRHGGPLRQCACRDGHRVVQDGGGAEHVGFLTLGWMDWLNTRRLLELLGHMLPVEFEELHCHAKEASGPHGQTQLRTRRATAVASGLPSSGRRQRKDREEAICAT